MSKSSQVVVTVLAVSLGAAVGYVLVSKPELRNIIKNKVKQTYRQTQDRADQMSEEVAVRAAKLTNNPKINQDWVENQWSELGY